MEGDTGTLSPVSPGTKERVRRGWTQARPHARRWALERRAGAPTGGLPANPGGDPRPCSGHCSLPGRPGRVATASSGPRFPGGGPSSTWALPSPPGICASRDSRWPRLSPRGPPATPRKALASSGPPGPPCTSWDGRWPHLGPQNPPASPGTASGLVWAPGTPMHVLGWLLASSEPGGAPCESRDGCWPRPSPGGPPAHPGMAAGLVQAPRAPHSRKPPLLLPNLRPTSPTAVREVRTRCVTSHVFYFLSQDDFQLNKVSRDSKERILQNIFS